MHPKLDNPTPIFDDGQISFERIKVLLNVSNEVTAKIIGVSEGTIRSGRLSHSTIRKSKDLIHILNMLWTLTAGDDKAVRRWLNDPRREWLGSTPMEMLEQRKARAVATYLEGLLDGEVIGS